MLLSHQAVVECELCYCCLLRCRTEVAAETAEEFEQVWAHCMDQCCLVVK
jgi:hypothetical protein